MFGVAFGMGQVASKKDLLNHAVTMEKLLSVDFPVNFFRGARWYFDSSCV